jgi:hypothetical protein
MNPAGCVFVTRRLPERVDMMPMRGDELPNYRKSAPGDHPAGGYILIVGDRDGRDAARHLGGM